MTAARINQQEIQPLPRWARLGLASRCVRRARNLLQPAPEQARVLDELLSRLDQANRTTRAGDELADAAAAAYTLALDNIDHRSSGDHDPAVAVCMAAHAAAFAAEAATLADPRQAAHLVAQSIDFAVHAARMADPAGASEAVVAMRADLERLQAETGWTDETAVPEGYFSSL